MNNTQQLANRPTKHHDIPFKGQGVEKSLIIGTITGSEPYGFRAGETIRLGYARGWAEVCGSVTYVLMEDLAKELEYHDNPAVFVSGYELLGMSLTDCRKLRNVDLFVWADPHPRSIPELNRRVTVPVYADNETACLWEAHKRIIESEPKFVWNSCGDAAAEFFTPWVDDGFKWEKLFQACDSERYYPDPNNEAFGHIKMAYIGRYWAEKAVSFDAYLRKWEDDIWIYGAMEWPYKNFSGQLSEEGERQLYSTVGMIPLVHSPGGHALAEVTERYFKTPGCRCFCIADVNPALRDIFTEEEMLQAESIEHFHELVSDYFAGKIDTKSYADKAYAAIQERHLYSHRAVQIRETLSSISALKPSKTIDSSIVVENHTGSEKDDIGNRLAAVQKKIDTNTGDSAYYIEAYKLLLEAGRSDEAKQYYEDACELDPTNPELHNITECSKEQPEEQSVVQPEAHKPMKPEVHKRIIANTQEFGRNNEEIRNSWVQRTLKKVPQGMRLLDAGAGEQRYRDCCRHLEYTAQDFGQYDGNGDAVGLQNQTAWDTSKNHIISDIVDIPVSDKSFDAILCTEVFEHLPEPVLALKEFSRILCPGGHLILTAPVCSLTHQSPYYFYNGFSRYFYEKFLPENGFSILEITPSGSYTEYLAQEVMRIPGIANCYCGLNVSNDVINSINVVLRALYECHQNDKGSSEILCYGYHVHAIKEA